MPSWIMPGGAGSGLLRAIIKGTQRGLRNPALVKELVQAMTNGTYDFNAARGIIAGYRDAKGIYYVTEGHHRMAAAFEVYKSTGNASAINGLLQNGRWTAVTKAPAGARPLPSTSAWGSFRNWLGF